MKLASCIPKEQRSSHDGLLLALDEILKDGEFDFAECSRWISFSSEKSTRLSEQEREELINQIDFSRVSEETITACKTNQLIPQKVITEAALALCVKLRRELDEAKSRLRLAEHELGKTRTTYTSSSRRICSFSPLSDDRQSRLIFSYANASVRATDTSLVSVPSDLCEQLRFTDD